MNIAACRNHGNAALPESRAAFILKDFYLFIYFKPSLCNTATLPAPLPNTPPPPPSPPPPPFFGAVTSRRCCAPIGRPRRRSGALKGPQAAEAQRRSSGISIIQTLSTSLHHPSIHPSISGRRKTFSKILFFIYKSVYRPELIVVCVIARCGADR